MTGDSGLEIIQQEVIDSPILDVSYNVILLIILEFGTLMLVLLKFLYKVHV